MLLLLLLSSCVFIYLCYLLIKLVSPSLLLGLELLGAQLATPRCAGSHEPWNLLPHFWVQLERIVYWGFFFLRNSNFFLLQSQHTWALLLHALLFKLSGEFSHSDERTRECLHVQDLRWYVEEICTNFFFFFFLCFYASVCNIIINLLNFLYVERKNRAESAWRWGWIMSWTLCQCLAAARQAQHNIAVIHFTRVFFPPHISWIFDAMTKTSFNNKTQPCVECWFVWCM